MPYLCTHQPASHVHKTPAYFYLFKLAHSTPCKTELCFSVASAVSVIWNRETVGERSRSGCSRLQLKFNEMETDTEFFSSRSNTLCTVSTDSLKCAYCNFERVNFAQDHVLTQTHARNIQEHASLHTCIDIFCTCTCEHTRKV